MPPSEADIRAALAGVNDPELDQSVVELGFIHEITIDAGTVGIGFRLPTFWCSANFAFMMAEDMRDAISDVRGVKQVRIRLVDHFAAPKINAGIDQGSSFRRVFGDEAADDLDAVRATFALKARLGRQAALIQHLRDAGWPDSRIVSLNKGDLEALEPSPARDRFLGIIDREAPSTTRIITDTSGNTVAASELTQHLRTIRRIRTSAEANGEMCRILLQARYAQGAP